MKVTFTEHHAENKYLMITAYMGCDYFPFKFHVSSPMCMMVFNILNGKLF